MNTPTPHDDEIELQRLRELLPLHAAGVLRGEELHFVEQALARHGAAHPELAAELSWLRTTATQARENAVERQPEAGLGELMARIAAERPRTARVAPAAPPPTGLGRWLAQWLAPRGPALAFALAGIVVVQTVVIGSLMQREGAEQQPLSGSVAEPAAQGVLFSVAFKPGTSEAELRALLQAAGVQVVGGPSALGLWRVAAPKAGADAAEAALRGATSLVESVQREP